jgi:hypothetical protein
METKDLRYLKNKAEAELLEIETWLNNNPETPFSIKFAIKNGLKPIQEKINFLNRKIQEQN